MPRLKPGTRDPPRSKLLESKAMKNGLRGMVFSASGDQYTGEWKDNMKHGKGTQIWKASGAVYEGEWKFGKYDGYGTYSVPQLDKKTYVQKYCGKWKNGMKHGYGTFFYKDSEVYEGDWSEGQRSGCGRLYYENGDAYEGEWLKDKKHGQGIMNFANGNWYDGQWENDMRNGNGKFFYSHKGYIYEGFWVDDQAKCGTVSDLRGEDAPTPKKYQIPQVQLVDMQSVLWEAQSACQSVR